ncbi:MAG: hypothetical protein K1Y02_15275, partial [Candidatus Hydrogenedentes bacterium]|nr:hypothetical protein [Candidatus Hydrogenedentota bacterium]
MRVQLLAVSIMLLSAAGAYAEPPAAASLAGDWTFRLDPEGKGIDGQWQNAAFEETVSLPGSLDENGKGTPNAEASRAYLSRLFEYVGPAWYQREVEVPSEWAGKPLEVHLERCHWETRLWVDDRLAGVQDSLCAPHVYALGSLTPGKHRLTLRVDNSIKYDVGSRAHSITEHTQTNWNGVIGRMELRALDPVGIASVQAYPNAQKREATVRVVLNNALDTSAACHVKVSALNASQNVDATISANGQKVIETVLQLGPDAPLWDEFDPSLIDLDVAVSGKGIDASRRVRFGLRDIATNGTQFTLNGRPYFVRGTLECCIFPLTGYPAMDVQHWRRMMETAKQYGLNHFRFHSWCPPEAAFIAADETGITFQVETPVWGDLGKNPDVDQYIHDEADRIFEAYGNHPSFVMLAVGNEPSGPNKDAFLTDIVTKWKAQDPSRLYTTCSGWPELPVSNYHVVHERNRHPYRLHGGPLGPNTTVDYRDVLEGCPQPAIAHELGQWCVYPDYREIPNYTGTLRARNLEGFRDSLARAGMLDQATDFARASGKLQRIMYKADIETMLRTPGAGGFQLLALQDFPGQGSALEGFIDAFWNSKGVVMPDEFRRFCSETVPLLRLEKFVWTNAETLKASAEIAHFGSLPLAHARPSWSIRTADGNEIASGQWPERDIPLGNGIALGELSWPLNLINTPTKLTISVFLAGTVYANSWDVWVYPSPSGRKLTFTAYVPGTSYTHSWDVNTLPAKEEHSHVLIADEWSPRVALKLRAGGKVLLLPKQIAPMRRVKSAFEPIFWNTQWFPGQSRQLGILCDPRHPAFASFPNDGYTDWQWWDLLNKSQVMRLDDLPSDYRPLVQVIDDWNKNRKLGAIFEGRVGAGRILVCSLDIWNGLDQRPAAA